MATQTKQTLVSAAFGRRDQAEAAIHELLDLGLTEDQLGVAVPEEVLREAAEDVAGAEEIKGAEAGFLIGGTVGSLAGVALMALVVGGLGRLGLGGILASAAAGGI